MSHPVATRAALCVALAVAAIGAQAQVSTQLTLGGAVNFPSTYDYASLKALPAVTQTVTFQAGSTPQTHTYTGADLWGMLSTAQVQTGSAKNDINNKYVIATGSDGYKVAYALGELNPSFGNKGSIVAYDETINGVTAPLGSDGFARITAPNDIKGGRYVSNLVSLTVGAPNVTIGSTAGGESTSFSVTGDVKQAMTFDLAALQALPSTTITTGGNSYTGVSFYSLLSSWVGLAINPNVKNDELDMIVSAVGSDGYTQLFSLGELDPAFGNAQDIIAYEENGAALPGTGFARVVVPGDAKAGRWVSNLVSLQVFHAALPVPEPGTWGLMLAGLAAMSLASKRRSWLRR
ncbi:MAG: PEP-CTERM sorting domain-containing protein [Proteobacteria bacterium]|nr:PEP-CTERM sorting domain-containing protein [Pseudomonadota bacterium]